MLYSAQTCQIEWLHFVAVVDKLCQMEYHKKHLSPFFYPKGVQNLYGKLNEGVHEILVIMASPGWCTIARECELYVVSAM